MILVSDACGIPQAKQSTGHIWKKVNLILKTSNMTAVEHPMKLDINAIVADIEKIEVAELFNCEMEETTSVDFHERDKWRSVEFRESWQNEGVE
jgi:hypothetical protein